jgi:hypothetical protein
MPFTQEDKDWLKETLNAQKDDLKTVFKDAVSQLGKRTTRLEHAFTLVTRAARSVVIDKAKKDHDALLRRMFDDADLLLIPPFESGSRKNFTCDIAQVEQFVHGYDKMYDVELNRNVGYRLIHKSRSAQIRRKAGASLLQKLKKEAPSKLGLNIQYDKPWELRATQTAAHKFLRSLADNGQGLVTSTKVQGGYLVVNGARIAPEYLIPAPGRWGVLFDAVLQKIRSGGSRAPASPESGVLSVVFEAEFAADRGVIDLSALQVDDYGDGMELD